MKLFGGLAASQFTAKDAQITLGRLCDATPTVQGEDGGKKGCGVALAVEGAMRDRP